MGQKNGWHISTGRQLAPLQLRVCQASQTVFVRKGVELNLKLVMNTIDLSFYVLLIRHLSYIQVRDSLNLLSSPTTLDVIIIPYVHRTPMRAKIFHMLITTGCIQLPVSSKIYPGREDN